MMRSQDLCEGDILQRADGERWRLTRRVFPGAWRAMSLKYPGASITIDDYEIDCRQTRHWWLDESVPR